LVIHHQKGRFSYEAGSDAKIKKLEYQLFTETINYSWSEAGR
jgi:hypothetical protein